MSISGPSPCRVRTPSHLSTCVVDATYDMNISKVEIVNRHQLLMSWPWGRLGTVLQHIYRQPRSLGKMARTVRSALHSNLCQIFLVRPLPYPQTNYVQQPSARAGQVLAMRSGPWPETLVKGSVPQSCRECKLTSYAMNSFPPPDQSM